MKRFALAALAACRGPSVATDPAIVPRTTPDAGAMTSTPMAAPDASAPNVVVQAKPVPVPDPPGAWLTRPPPKSDFYVALDGICRYLRVDTAGGDAFAITTAVPYIRTAPITILARVTPDGLADMSKGAGPVTALHGHYPDALFAVHSGQERIYIGSEIVRWQGSEWVRAFKNPHNDDENALRREYDPPIAWKNGFVSISKWNKPAHTWTSNAAPGDEGVDLQAIGVATSDLAPLSRPGWTPKQLVSLPGGELFAISERAIVRWLDASGAVHEYAATTAHPDMRLTGATTAELRIESGGKAIARFDGTTFTTADLPPAPPPAAKMTPPTPDATIVAGKWAYTKKGQVWARDGETWTAKTLPPPAFGTSTARSISSFEVLPSGEALFVVGYYEKGRGWKDPVLYHSLVRSERPAETLRCNEPDPENLVVSSGSGFTSWPPLADDACTTPFVILGRKSNAHPPPAKDWPGIRRAMKGKQRELGDTVDLVELRAGDRTYVGAPTTTVAAARTLLDTVAKATPTRGEIVCAVPTATRTFHVDIASGEAR